MFLHKNTTGRVRRLKSFFFFFALLSNGNFFKIEVNVYIVKYPDSTKSYIVKSNSSTPVFFFFHLHMEVVDVSGSDES